MNDYQRLKGVKMNMVKIKSTNVLWKFQYAPRERAIKKSLSKNALKKWNKQTRIQKIIVIDRLKAKGLIG
ncbi:MAG: hypothetical protein KAS32_18550 [Candidatus Peribacteraceae bacterium]|nr:hypothetical protein [Candidatus Peribacteraceae bacterium]